MIDNQILERYDTKAKYIKTKDGLFLKHYSENINGFNITLLEQDKSTGSQWAKKAINGDEVIQVFVEGDFYGVFVNEKLTVY